MKLCCNAEAELITNSSGKKKAAGCTQWCIFHELMVKLTVKNVLDGAWQNEESISLIYQLFTQLILNI